MIKSLLSDSTGQVSTMRVAVLIVIAAVIGSKFYNAWLTKMPVTWDSNDWLTISSALAGKLIQNTQENATVDAPAKPA